MTFAEYYSGQFRDDLARVVAGLLAIHDHGQGEVTIQPRSISRRNPVIRGWSDQRPALFACGLFLTILADQVCYTHFRASYPAFRRLTEYPKWRGDCPGGCYSHIHAAVFHAIGAEEGRLAHRLVIPFTIVPADLVETMRHEVVHFVERYLPGVDPDEFWKQCSVELPVEVRTTRTDQADGARSNVRLA